MMAAAVHQHPTLDMAKIRLQPPDKFDFKKPDDWSHWKRRFQQFRIASVLDTQSDSQAKLHAIVLYGRGGRNGSCVYEYQCKSESKSKVSLETSTLLSCTNWLLGAHMDR